MIKTCAISGSKFEITPEDEKFYKLQGVPPPTLCPDERQRRRLIFRNERNLFTRKDSMTGEQIVARWEDGTSFPVYSSKNWWSDRFDPLEYGRPLDFNRPFFDQFLDLRNEIPHIALYNFDSENSEYTNHAGYNKNAYMCYNAGYLEDCYYVTNYAIRSKDCCDCYAIEESELLYECFMCKNCYSSRYLVNCETCRDSNFLFDCKNCRNCFMCWNLRSKHHCIRNEQKTKEEYEAFMASPATNLGSHKRFAALIIEFKDSYKHKATHKATLITKSENCTGDYITSSKNVHQSYYVIDCEDVRYCYDILGAKDCCDAYEPAWGLERHYETHASNETKFMIGCNTCLRSAFFDYCDNCHNSKHLFGCYGMKKNEYCILNKQYDRPSYERLRAQLIDHMTKTGEWGEFFPHNHSSFAYNDTKAQDYYPLTKTEALARGYKWRDEEKKDFKPPTLATANIPDNIAQAPDSSTSPISDEILACEVTGKNYKITPQEFKLYKRQNIPIPRRHHDTRYQDRLIFRHRRTLFNRTCPNCNTQTLSVFNEQDPEKILCEKCYLKKTY
ncbi:MAG: hypothetical protein WC604_03485 [Candidatus Gracilibacteria bacterium]